MFKPLYRLSNLINKVLLPFAPIAFNPELRKEDMAIATKIFILGRIKILKLEQQFYGTNSITTSKYGNLYELIFRI